MTSVPTPKGNTGRSEVHESALKKFFTGSLVRGTLIQTLDKTEHKMFFEQCYRRSIFEEPSLYQFMGSSKNLHIMWSIKTFLHRRWFIKEQDKTTLSQIRRSSQGLQEGPFHKITFIFTAQTLLLTSSTFTEVLKSFALV